MGPGGRPNNYRRALLCGVGGNVAARGRTICFSAGSLRTFDWVSFWLGALLDNSNRHHCCGGRRIRKLQRCANGQHFGGEIPAGTSCDTPAVYDGFDLFQRLRAEYINPTACRCCDDSAAHADKHSRLENRQTDPEHIYFHKDCRIIRIDRPGPYARLEPSKRSLHLLMVEPISKQLASCGFSARLRTPHQRSIGSGTRDVTRASDGRTTLC